MIIPVEGIITDLFTEDAYVHFGYLMPGGRPWTGEQVPDYPELAPNPPL